MRLYGFTSGYGSYAQVLRGFVEGLRPLKLPVVSIDNPSEDIIGGATDRTGVMLGPPTLARELSSTAHHQERVVMVAPNSTWLPDALVILLDNYATEVLTPSAWGKSVLDPLLKRAKITVVPHGVLEDFKPMQMGEDVPTPEDSYANGYFDVLHVASTSRQRKGTRELIAAWRLLRSRGNVLPKEARLVCSLPSDDALSLIMDLGKLESDIVMHPRWNVDPKTMSTIYSNSHVTCQPSRGEGFGLVPLESLACGTPVVVSDVTGHTEYTREFGQFAMRGAVLVPGGALEPIDDGPGALGPRIEAEDVARALEFAYNNWRDLRSIALADAARIKEKFSWKVALAEFRERAMRESKEIR